MKALRDGSRFPATIALSRSFACLLAPLMTFIFAAISWVVVPFADGWVITDLKVGVLYIFAISSLGVYGVIMGG